jgi:Domain of unknown function (DUF4124)
MRPVSMIAALSLVAVSIGARADVFRVVDSQGQVQYTDRWVPGAELIRTERSRSVSPSAPSAPTDAQKALAAGNARIAAQQSDQAASHAVAQDVASKRAEQCKAAKERYDKDIEARRIYRAGKDGEKEFLTDEQIDQERLQARQEMQQVCGSASK